MKFKDHIYRLKKNPNYLLVVIIWKNHNVVNMFSYWKNNYGPLTKTEMCITFET